MRTLRKFFAATLFAATAAFCQQTTVPAFSYPGVTFNIPQPDGTTIVVNSAGKWSCAVSAGLPAGLTFDGTTFTAPKLSAQSINLTSGTTYPAGTYLVTLDASSNFTLTPYVAPTGGGSGSTVIGATIAVPSSTIAAFAEQSKTYTLVGLPAPSTPAVVFVNPSIDFGGNVRYSYRVTAANTIVLKLTNVVSSAQTVPAYTLYLSAIH